MSEVYWRMSQQTLSELDVLAEQLQDAEEGSEEYYIISDQIRALPNCPLNTNETEDIIIPVLVIAPRVGYTGPASVGNH